jgi:hypothetical protein
LTNNEGHQAYVNETWTISNWKNNSIRYDVSGSKPWDRLKSMYSGLTGNYNSITVSKLYSTVTSIKPPVGVNGNAKVVDVLAISNSFQAYIIVAQLNHLLLASSGWDKCLSLEEINDMADGQYSPGDVQSVVWVQNDIKKYLYENWIVRP